MNKQRFELKKKKDRNNLTNPVGHVTTIRHFRL